MNYVNAYAFNHRCPAPVLMVPVFAAIVCFHLPVQSGAQNREILLFRFPK
jgi:hypothetical protein